MMLRGVSSKDRADIVVKKENCDDKSLSRSPSGSECNELQHEAGSALDNDDVLYDSSMSVGPRRTKRSSSYYFNDDSNSIAMKKRKKNPALSLNEERENDLIDWLHSHPELFDRGNKKYKDVDLKSRLWEDKAAELEVGSGELLHVWYTSMRTRFGKLRRIKEMNANKRVSARDQWILEKFDFISPHIHVCPTRWTAGTPNNSLQSTRSYIYGTRSSSQAYSGSEDNNDEEESYINLLANCWDNPTAAVSGSSSAAAAVTLPAVEVKDITDDQFSRSTLPQIGPVPVNYTAVPSTPSPPAAVSSGRDSMAKGYGTFLSTVVTSLHPSLLTQFYQESWELVMKYHVLSDRLKEQEAQHKGGDSAVKNETLSNHVNGR